MNHQQFANKIQSMLGQYDQATKFDDRDIFAVADGYRGIIWSQIYDKTKEMPNGDFIRSYKIILVPDPMGTGLMQFALPVTIANGPDNMGIRSISNPVFPFRNWVALQPGRSSQFKVSDYGGRTVYWLEGTTVQVYPAAGTTTGILKCIPCLSDPQMDTDTEIFGDSRVEGFVTEQTFKALMIKKQTPKLAANNGRV